MKRALLLAALSCASAPPPAPRTAAPEPVATTPSAPPSRAVLDVAARTGKLGAFLAALDKNELSPPLTLLAPPDEAFAVIPEAKRGNAARHHVVQGEIGDARTVVAFDGRPIEVRREGAETYVDGARVIARVGAADGEIWILERALDPDAPAPDLHAAMIRAGARSFAALAARVAIPGNGPFTVFAPTDAALADLEPPKDLRAFVTRFVVRGRLERSALEKLERVRNVAGEELAVSELLKSARGPYVSNNGLVYAIERAR